MNKLLACSMLMIVNILMSTSQKKEQRVLTETMLSIGQHNMRMNEGVQHAPPSFTRIDPKKKKLFLQMKPIDWKE